MTAPALHVTAKLGDARGETSGETREERSEEKSGRNNGKGGENRDEKHMRAIYNFTARTLETKSPVPFGALIVNTQTGKPLMRATNAVRRENDPSSHAEVRTVRLACKKLKRTSLAGFTMYSTCEPCPMCMANALWARLDRVVFGATIADANRHCLQIHISATEIAQRADMPCVVDGPLLRQLCNTLFTHPNMQKAFRSWSSSKEHSSKKGSGQNNLGRP
jgi:tRNA(Arg) A34 adenosine deaminase TadA